MKMPAAFAAMMVLFSVAAMARPDFIKPGEKAPDFTLRDQFDAEYSLAAQSGAIVAILYTGRDKSDAAAEFARTLEKEFKGENSKGAGAKRLEVIKAGNMKGVPKLLKNTIKKHIKNKKHDGKPDPSLILLDWKGYIADKYGYDKNEVNMFIIGEDRAIVFAGIASSKDAQTKAVELLRGLM